MSRRHLVRVGALRETERAVPVYGRLNVRHGPNVAQAVRQFEEDDHVDLDLATMAFDENRVSAAWVDLIFEAPAMNRLILTDVTLSRRPKQTWTPAGIWMKRWTRLSLPLPSLGSMLDWI